MKTLTVVSVLVLAIGIVSAIAGSGAVPTCSIVGTPERDVLAGTPTRDVICARGGGDFVSGGGGRDVLRGDGGRDVLVGGRGRDRVLGMGGDDRVFTVDGREGDVANGGSGTDQCFVDPGDRVRGCEQVFRAGSISTTKLSGAFHGQGSLAEELIEEAATATATVTMTGPPPATVTVTVTRTASFPPCTPPPASPPSPC